MSGNTARFDCVPDPVQAGRFLVKSPATTWITSYN